MPGALSPTVAEGVMRLATDLPFDRAARTLAFFWRVQLSAATVRRHTEVAGGVAVEAQTAEAEALDMDTPEPPVGPARQQLSADGAMVPLVGGEWAEVKTLALGTLLDRVGPETDEPHATDLTYFSRMTDAATFGRLAAVEIHRRGTERAGTVVAVMDGAEWLQALVDRYRPDAVRVLDFPHAVEHLWSAAHAVWGGASADAAAWVQRQAHTLKHDDPADVLTAVRALPTDTATDPGAAATTRAGTLSYLEKRREQIQYAQFRAHGYPIGSGMIESANKLVVEARLKGSGMHWARHHVNPMLALRNVTCADRWGDTVPLIRTRLRAAAARSRTERWRARHPEPVLPTVESDTPPAPQREPRPHIPDQPKLFVDGRPTAHHPWRAPLKPYPTPAGKI